MTRYQFQRQLDGGSLRGAHTKPNEQNPLACIHRREHIATLEKFVVCERHGGRHAQPAKRLRHDEWFSGTTCQR
jgi:hypothetical protein